MSKYGKANNIVACLFKDVAVTIGVRFLSYYGETMGQVYTYKGWRSDNYEAGDTVIVESSFRGLALAKVVRVDDFLDVNLDSEFTYKWVVQKVDCTAYEEHNKKEIRLKKRLQRNEDQKEQQKAINLLGNALSLYKHMFKERFENEPTDSDDCTDQDNHQDEVVNSVACRIEHYETFAETHQKLLDDALKPDGNGNKILLHLNDEQIEKIRSGCYLVKVGRRYYKLLYCDFVDKVAVVRA